jgi:uncharacterized membrane protein YGL010W
MRTADEWFDAYGASHQNPVNKAIHWICVPAIAFTVVGLFWSIPMDAFRGVLPGRLEPFLNWGTIVLGLTSLFYLSLSFTLFLGMLFFGALCLLGNYGLVQADLAPLWAINLGIFVVAWIFQFVGHKIEGQKPSFFEDVQFLLVGPAWLLQFIYRRAGIPV